MFDLDEILKNSIINRNFIDSDKTKVDKVGAPLLEGLTTRLYTEIYEVLREYISNSVDAEADQIDIICEEPYDKITIYDNGNGIKNLEDLSDAFGIMYGKELEESEMKKRPQIGLFGIGIYAGAKICDNIEIITTGKNSPELMKALIPIGKWIEKSSLTSPIRYELRDITNYWIVSEQQEKYKELHYTKVTLLNLKENAINVMKVEKTRKKLITKLRRVIPIGYNPSMELVVSSYIKDNYKTLKLDKIDYKKFMDWRKEKLDDVLNRHGLEFDSMYNNTSISFNGEPLYRLYPEKGEKEPLLPMKYWRVKEFYIHKDNGEKQLVGVGWAAFRGSRLKRNRKAKNPIQFSGTFDTKEIAGVQIRLNNVEIISFGRIWNSFNLKLSSQKFDHIWGEIYLFDYQNKIKITPKRTDFIKDDVVCIEILDQIKKWVKNLLRYLDKKRKTPGRWQYCLIRNERINGNIDLIKEFLELQKEKEYSIEDNKEFKKMKEGKLDSINKNYKEFKEQLSQIDIDLIETEILQYLEGLETGLKKKIEEITEKITKLSDFFHDLEEKEKKRLIASKKTSKKSKKSTKKTIETKVKTDSTEKTQTDKEQDKKTSVVEAKSDEKTIDEEEGEVVENVWFDFQKSVIRRYEAYIKHNIGVESLLKFIISIVNTHVHEKNEQEEYTNYLYEELSRLTSNYSKG